MGLDQVVDAALADTCLDLRIEPTGPGMVVVACSDHDGASEAVVRSAASAVVEHGIPMAGDTPLYAASLAKLVTALCVHRLVAAGGLSLDDPVRRWFPALADRDRITVRHLLLHRSGLPEYHALRLIAGNAVEDRLLPTDVRRMVDSMGTWFEPGSRVSYNNTNYAMAATIVSEVTGRAFADAAADLVFAPTGMAGAVVRADPGTFLAGMAAGYVRTGSAWRRAVHGSTSVGDGGMWWSGDDLLALARTLLDGRDADPSIVAMRHQVSLPDGSLPSLATGCSAASDGSWFGGIAEFTGFAAELRVYPDRGLAIGAMSNRQDGRPGALLDRLALGLGIEPPPSAPAPARRRYPAPRGTLVGLGGAPWHFVTSAASDADDVAVAVGDVSFRLIAEGDAWQVAGTPSHTAGWESDEFVLRDGRTEIARLHEVGGEPPTAETLDELTGWWWCASAAAVLRIDLTDQQLLLRRGVNEPERLVPIGDRGGHWVLAAPWGLVELAHDGRTGRVVLHRAEGLPLARLVSPPRPLDNDRPS